MKSINLLIIPGILAATLSLAAAPALADGPSFRDGHRAPAGYRGDRPVHRQRQCKVRYTPLHDWHRDRAREERYGDERGYRRHDERRHSHD